MSLVAVALVSACATPHAVKVRCDGHLTPINAAPAPKADEPGGRARETERSAAP